MKRIVLVSLLLLPMSSLAVPVQWTLDGYLISNWVEGGRATGSFVYDADTGVYSDIALSTTGTSSGGLTFTNFASEYYEGLNFFQAGATGVEPTIAFHLNGIFSSQLTNAGGVLTVNPNTNSGYFAEYSCGGIDTCELGFGSAVSNWHAWNPIQSTLTGVPLTSVDEPGTLALLGAAVALALYTRRRRAAKCGG